MPRQIPVHIFFLAIKVSLLLYSQSGSHFAAQAKHEINPLAYN